MFTLIQRSRVSSKDCWDLSALFINDEDWADACEAVEIEISMIDQFQGKLGSSADMLYDYLELRFKISKQLGKIHYFA